MRQLVACFLTLVVLVGSTPAAQRPPGPEIRLVLLIAVDQFRYDYLTRFRGEYTSGLRRLLTEGAVFSNAYLEHYPTVTAVGHSTMLTGATPSISGIIGNDWYDRESSSRVESITDREAKAIGSPSASAASPRRLLVSTVGDELKIAAAVPKTSPEAPRVFGVSLKDRSAVMPAGRGANGAYWLDTKTGAFASSTYYMPDVPAWVKAFNDRKLADTYAGRPWAPSSGPAFKPIPPAGSPGFYDAVYGSPYGNDLLLEFASELLAREELGIRNATDLLSVSFSSNDSVGHAFGPESPQVHDISVKTDRTIGALLNLVDKTVGLQRTIVAFTADHAVAPVPESLRERGLPGGRMTSRELFDPIQQALVAKYGAGDWFLATAGSSPYLNYELIAKMQLDPVEVRRAAAAAAARVPHVARVYTRDQLLAGGVGNDRVASRILRGFNAQRSGDLEIVLEPYWMRQAVGTTHGSPYNYDAHIPLVLMGARIQPGEYSNAAALNDLAPTLATLLKVEIPGGSVGRVLNEAFRPAPGAAPTRTQ